METEVLRVAPKNNPNAFVQVDDDLVVCKYIAYFTKHDNDDTAFPGKPTNIKKNITVKSVMYTFYNKYYVKDNKNKLSCVRDIHVTAYISKKETGYSLDIKYTDNLNKKDNNNVSPILIKKENIIAILDKLLAK